MTWIAWIIVFLIVFTLGYSVGRIHGLVLQNKRETIIMEKQLKAFANMDAGLDEILNSLNARIKK
jgi:hypothetical protein